MKTVLLWMSIHLLVQKKMRTCTHIYHLQMRTIKLIVCHTTLRRWWSYVFHRHTWRLHLIRSVNVVAPLGHSLTKPHRDPVQNLQLNEIVFCSQWVKYSQKLSLAYRNYLWQIPTCPWHIWRRPNSGQNWWNVMIVTITFGKWRNHF